MRSPMSLASPLQPSYFKPCTRAFAGGRKTTAKLAAEIPGPHPTHSRQVSAATAPDPTGKPHRGQRGHAAPRSRVRQALQTNSAERSRGRWSRQPRQTPGRKNSRSSATSARPFTRGCAQTGRLPKLASSPRSGRPLRTIVRRTRRPGARASPRHPQPESQDVWRLLRMA